MSSARRNLSDHARVDLSRVYSYGTFKLVYKGSYTRGPRKNQACVSKLFKSGSVYEDSFFATELDVISAAMNIVEKFNQEQFIDRHIFLNEPTVWEYEHDGQRNLVEPFIKDFQKFNSNSGWRDDDGTPWNLVMQALSHFSYHCSGGRLVLCDLQGGIYSDGAVLTDPVVLSRDSRYGPSDLGTAGIETFFARHECNQYCRSNWQMPRNLIVHFDEREGTSMIRVPTRASRYPLSYY